MAQKKAWISWIASAENKTEPGAIMQPLQKNGMATAGSRWIDDVAKGAWAELLPLLSDAKQTDAWIIALDRASSTLPSVRYALSILAETLRQRRGATFPIVLIGIDFAPAAEQLPTFLRGCDLYKLSDAGWAVKLVARFFKKGEGAEQEFRFSAYANEYTGQWFEVGPREGVWNGAMFGVSGDARITHHAVGPKGALPERTVLEYQIKDMKAKVGATEFTVWSVQNAVDMAKSYFIKVEGQSPRIVLGGHPGSEQAEVYVVDLT